MNRAVYNAYESLIKRGEYPFFVINLLLPGDQVDVNVHPTKTEVRFKDEWRLFHLLKSEVGNSLGSVLDTIPGFDTSFQQSSSGSSIGDFSLQRSKVSETIPVDPNQNTIDFSHSDTLHPSKSDILRARDYVTKLAETSIDDQSTIAT